MEVIEMLAVPTAPISTRYCPGATSTIANPEVVIVAMTFTKVEPSAETAVRSKVLAPPELARTRYRPPFKVKGAVAAIPRLVNLMLCVLVVTAVPLRANSLTLAGFDVVNSCAVSVSGGAVRLVLSGPLLPRRIPCGGR